MFYETKQKFFLIIQFWFFSYSTFDKYFYIFALVNQSLQSLSVKGFKTESEIS